MPGAFPASTANTSTSQIWRPVSGSKARTRRDSLADSLTAVVRNKRPPESTGEDQPWPGTTVFQATLRLVVHSKGKFPETLPFPVDPRNSGQTDARLAPKAAWAKSTVGIMTLKNRLRNMPKVAGTCPPASSHSRLDSPVVNPTSGRVFPGGLLVNAGPGLRA